MIPCIGGLPLPLLLSHISIGSKFKKETKVLIQPPRTLPLNMKYCLWIGGEVRESFKQFGTVAREWYFNKVRMEYFFKKKNHQMRVQETWVQISVLPLSTLPLLRVNENKASKSYFSPWSRWFPWSLQLQYSMVSSWLPLGLPIEFDNCWILLPFFF